MILFVTQNFLPRTGGIQQYVTRLADALHRRGHALEVMCRAGRADADRAFDATRAYRIRRFGGPRLWRQWRTRQAVLERLSLGDVTVLVADTWKSLEPLPPSALSGVRVVSLAHGNEFLARDSRREKRISASIGRADAVAAVSGFTADLARTYGAKAEVVWPGITPPPAPAELLPKTGSRLLTIARLEPRKGVDRVIEAMPGLLSLWPDLIYDVVGEGADRPRLEALTIKRGVRDQVRFHGRLSDTQMGERLAAADIFVLPNRREPGSVEGFGLVFVEAAAFGVPSVAGDDGGAGDAVLDGTTGLVVDGTSVQSVEAALRALLSDEALRQRMGQAARRRYEAEFAWDAAIPRFEKVLGLKKGLGL